MTITVEVTREDIERGNRRDCYACPVALAVNRATGLRWSVGVWMVASTPIKPLGRVDTPQLANRFIANFDDRKPVQPFSFDLDLPPAIVAAMKDKVKA